MAFVPLFPFGESAFYDVLVRFTFWAEYVVHEVNVGRSLYLFSISTPF